MHFLVLARTDASSNWSLVSTMMLMPSFDGSTFRNLRTKCIDKCLTPKSPLYDRYCLMVRINDSSTLFSSLHQCSYELMTRLRSSLVSFQPSWKKYTTCKHMLYNSQYTTFNISRALASIFTQNLMQTIGRCFFFEKEHRRAQKTLWMISIPFQLHFIQTLI